MLRLLNISNIALIDQLQVEFDRGLNLLTGETGSGKSIIVDALGLLVGGRSTSELIKTGEAKGFVEGLFSIPTVPELKEILDSAGIEMDGDELIIRRELSAIGKNKIYINSRLATGSVLRDLRPFLVDIHGQGDQQTLFNPDTHLDLFDSYASLDELRVEVARRHRTLSDLRVEAERLRMDEAERFQLADTLQFQIGELQRAGLVPAEDERLEEERKRLNNIERISTLCSESFSIAYEQDDSAVARLGQVLRRVQELSEYDSGVRTYVEGLESARALLEDLAFTVRDFLGKLEFSPERLAEVEARLAEIYRLKRKYGGSIASAIGHLETSRERLLQLEHSGEKEKELKLELGRALDKYLESAMRLHKERIRAVKKFETGVVRSLAEVAMENARFEAKIQSPSDAELAAAMPDARSELVSRPLSGEALTDLAGTLTPRGIDRLEFHFSANVGEPPRPLAKVASGGEASRTMLVLKTIANTSRFPRTIVFDEIDSGIGGRVSEAVGAKLKRLSEANQVLCVTHQPQIARFADCHLLIRKEVTGGRTLVTVERLEGRMRVEEIARMLTGSEITEAARRHAREMLRTA
ncbi:MAG TPA: DNA repair protein RecN [Blastocatellia bacterium]|nr:DNA repair protein RecN [Blastocatellia bacterium]